MSGTGIPTTLERLVKIEGDDEDSIWRVTLGGKDLTVTVRGRPTTNDGYGFGYELIYDDPSHDPSPMTGRRITS